MEPEMRSAADTREDAVTVGTIDGVMGGEPLIMGTRVPVETILIYLKAGRRAREIYEDFPTLPAGGIEAATAWAERELGVDWLDKIGRHGVLR
jgi:uncharacterized protein (DUF433 family)